MTRWKIVSLVESLLGIVNKVLRRNGRLLAEQFDFNFTHVGLDRNHSLPFLN